jgi:uncharacterized membrane protein
MKTNMYAYLSVFFGILTWVLPFGIIISILAIVFGVVGFWKSQKNDRRSLLLSCLGVGLGLAARIGYTIAMNQSIMMTLFVSLLISTILLVKFTRK